ncbi:hypothetical protein ACQ4WP_28650 [Janthinobacterium sp. GB4P2]|uniref:hypothetical protein n=1 Tax=Janthinobacterium sp. GB4P2 TaxID=3424189 RepID=UPI003F239F98
MTLTRDQFDSPGYLPAMDEIAMLLFITQELRKMSVTFANSPEIEKRDADAPASVALKAIGSVAQSLVVPLFLKSSKREPMLAAARKEGVKKLDIAVKNAGILANMERQAFAGTAARGDNIQVQVIGRLEVILESWRQLAG